MCSSGSGQRTSWVVLLTDLNSRIPVSIGGGKDCHSTQAMLTGDNSAMPMLDILSRTITLHDGDPVISSGDGGLVPPGLPIGTVVLSSGGYRVALLADSSASEDVEVLAFGKPPELMPETPTQLPAVAAGLPPARPPPPTPTVVAPPVIAPTPLPVAPRPAANLQAQGARSAATASDPATPPATGNE